MSNRQAREELERRVLTAIRHGSKTAWDVYVQLCDGRSGDNELSKGIRLALARLRAHGTIAEDSRGLRVT